MLAGIAVGRIMRSTMLPGRMDKPISYTIMTLLFLLGISVGTNKSITSNLAALGGQALLLSLAGTTGSILAGWAVYRLFFSERIKRKNQRRH